MADKRISQLIERTDIANNDVLPIVASGATTTNKVTISTIQEWMQDNLDVGVTSVGITIGSTGTDVNVSGSPITTSGNITINIPTASATNRGLLSSTDWSTFNNKLSSVGLTMPSAFTVSNSPLTANGTIAVTGAGTVAQYIRGDGSLADFPEAGGGGASVSYYLNGSVSQGTIGGIAYLEMSKTPILGAGTNFTINANGYIASFITDAGDPNLLLIPGGNWNFETYFAASSGGGTPSFYVELYKVSGSTATLVASNSANPELIAFGTTTTAYFSSLAVPATTLTLTDRLALRYYVTHAGRTITLHTENSNLCQIITTFTTGLTALNGLTAQVQNFATGTSGTDFNISSTSATHTFNLPDASASNRGAVTTGTQTFAGYKIFNGTIGVNNDLQLATVGTALNTFIKNINSTGLTSIGSNGFGFNNANNIYFSGSSKGGGVFAFSNTGTQTYTLQDASGTLAFTSDLGNYIQGVGTADSIPKFTAARTLANSAIRDTTSTVVISKNVSVDNGASQAINLTPASGGTTNRIETTGTLPLAIITSGSSITLAAGGVTPQITLASTGAVTLTGALNGTTASFGNTGSGSFTIQASNNDQSNARINITNTGSGGQSVNLVAGIPNVSNSGFAIAYGNNTILGFSSTGAATFSGSASASQFVANGSSAGGYEGLRIVNASTGAAQIALNNSAQSWLVNTRTDNQFSIFNSTASTTPLLISTTGAATFSSSVTARNGVFKNPGSDPNNTLFVQTSDYVFASAGSLLRLGHVATTGNTTATIQNLTLGGTGTGNISFPDGNVGIGTASPDSQLTLNGSSNSRLNMRAGDTRYGTLYADNGVFAVSSITAIPLVLGTNDTERMRITSTGNVGIGTASPAARLEVTSNSPVSAEVQRWSYNTGNPDFILKLRQEVVPGIVKHVFDVVNSGTNYSNNLVLTNGNVGIGTANPLSNLVISNGSNENIEFFPGSSVLNGGILEYINRSSGTTRPDFNIYNGSSNGNVKIYTGGNTERMRITSQGYLKASNTGSYQGVSDRYHELRTNLSDEWTAIIGNSSSSPYGIQLRYAGASPNGTANQFLVCSDSTVDRLRIASNGNVTNTNGSYGAISDAKLKENIEDASPKLDDLMKVKVRNYNLIGDDKKQIGVIAQELEEVFPAMIDESEDFEEVEVPQVDEEGNEILNEEGEVQTSKQRVSKGTTTKSVKYSVFVPMLIKAMQEQQEQIKSLTEQVEALKSQING